jgi:hypothetical protein
VILVIVVVIALRYRSSLDRFVDDVLLPKVVHLTKRNNDSQAVPAAAHGAAEKHEYDAASF